MTHTQHLSPLIAFPASFALSFLSHFGPVLNLHVAHDLQAHPHHQSHYYLALGLLRSFPFSTMFRDGSPLSISSSLVQYDAFANKLTSESFASRVHWNIVMYVFLVNASAQPAASLHMAGQMCVHDFSTRSTIFSAQHDFSALLDFTISGRPTRP